MDYVGDVKAFDCPLEHLQEPLGEYGYNTWLYAPVAKRS